MGKILNVVCIMMMIIPVFVIGGEADCNVICSTHCSKPSAPAERCSVCHKTCNAFPPSVRTEILKIRNSTRPV
ncbi:hypothetical protein IGI04_033485 [Brassica rapa subsp. trilocularis]|uniref:Uncharacterized protein n=1 Tax=Brassica rapa subsp. trilocularis TaxID=1813537 RepID=A0ABQ7L8U0_BRACM|nr:hypothetical protein IGI04_033485 [Brassica rapa subsp. trilocularis]